MAWIIGQLTETELQTLRDAGWVDEDPPEELLSEDEVHGIIGEYRTRAFFVDSDVFTVMTGADWDQPVREE